MRRLFSKLANRISPTNKGRAARRGAPRALLCVETLETRQVLSGFSTAGLATPKTDVASPKLLTQGVVLDPIQAKYYSLGGAGGFLGLPVTPEQATGYDGGIYEVFQGGAIYYSQSTGAHETHGLIWAEYQATAHEKDAYGNVVQKLIGLPTSDETDVPGVIEAMKKAVEKK